MIREDLCVRQLIPGFATVVSNPGGYKSEVAVEKIGGILQVSKFWATAFELMQKR